MKNIVHLESHSIKITYCGVRSILHSIHTQVTEVTCMECLKSVLDEYCSSDIFGSKMLLDLTNERIKELNESKEIIIYQEQYLFPEI